MNKPSIKAMTMRCIVSYQSKLFKNKFKKLMTLKKDVYLKNYQKDYRKLLLINQKVQNFTKNYYMVLYMNTYSKLIQEKLNILFKELITKF